jgi:hypothetical protein
MEKKEIKRVLERIYRFLKDNKGRFYVDDCETVTLYEGMSEIIEQELSKAREEGYEEGMKAILYPKLKRDKNGTIKREGWVNTSKLNEEK